MEIQAQIPAALCAIHNFICTHDPREGDLPADVSDDEDRSSEDFQVGGDAQDDVTGIEEDDEFEFQQGSVMQDHIASAMWTDYQCIVLEWGFNGVDLDSESDSEDMDSSEGEEGNNF